MHPMRAGHGSKRYSVVTLVSVELAKHFQTLANNIPAVAALLSSSESFAEPC